MIWPQALTPLSVRPASSTITCMGACMQRQHQLHADRSPLRSFITALSLRAAQR